MKEIKNINFDNERALFKSNDSIVNNCSFDVGESPLKESKNIEVTNSTFLWKYPLWYCDKVKVTKTKFEVGARAGIWYTKNAIFDGIDITAPKSFRKCNNITLKNFDFGNLPETLWWNDDVTLENIKASGDYFGLGSKNIRANKIDINGLYAFDGISNSSFKNSKLITKDAFWNSSNLVIEDSYIECEYFGWNSKNITLINCEIKSHQGFCYMDNIKLINCKISGDLMFEYCTKIDGHIINSGIDSIKNPISGKLIIDKKCPLIINETDPKKMKIIFENE